MHCVVLAFANICLACVTCVFVRSANERERERERLNCFSSCVLSYTVHTCIQVPVNPEDVEAKLAKMRRASDHLGISEVKVSILRLL